jgi:hypothetical protein
MKTLLAATALTLLVTPALAETPCNAKVQALQKQVNALADKADAITDRCTGEWFNVSNRFLVLTRQYQAAAKQDEGCVIKGPDMVKTTIAVMRGVEKECGAKEEAEGEKNIVKWEKESRNEVPRTAKPAPKAKALVVKANSLLKGDPTCSQMHQASKLLDKAFEEYERANAKFLGDALDRTLVRRVSWLEDLAEKGKCRK